MNLVLNTFGTYLHRDGEMFVINIKNEKDENKKREVSARKVRSILITTGAALSTDAIRLAIAAGGYSKWRWFCVQLDEK